MFLEDLPSVGKITLSEKVYNILVKSIIGGELPPGTKLQEKHIAKQLDVSATPVREAFKRMAGDGFIELVPYCGAVVKELDYREIEEAYTCRVALEKLALKEALSKMDDTLVEKLSRVNEEYKTSHDFIEFSGISQKFHAVIYQCADNSMLNRLLGVLDTVIARDRKISATNEVRKQEIYKEHMRIIQALRDRNLGQAEAAIEEHIMNGLYYIEKRA